MEISVNHRTQFRPDGVAIHFDAAGAEKSRGTYEIDGNRILYTDAKGLQEWDVISFGENELHLDHRGAQMFFIRQ